MGLQPATARVIRDGVERDLALEQVVAADLVRVRPAKRSPPRGATGSRSAISRPQATW
jgi:Cu+-exporting ATPase